MKIENRYRDAVKESGKSWTNNTYEITFRDKDGRTHKAVLQACSKDEARELFDSLPQAKCVLEVLEIKGVIGNVYFV